jgi:hypothetical protein
MKRALAAYMERTGWSQLLLCLCVATMLFALLDIASFTVLPRWGRAGWSLRDSGRPFVVEVIAVTRAAARSGLEIGDRIDLREYGLTDRVLIPNFYTTVFGYPLHLRVHRNGATRGVTFVSPRFHARWDSWLGYIAGFWMVTFAALIAWRRPAMREARVLSALLTLFGLAAALSVASGTYVSAAANIATSTLSSLLFPISFALLATFATFFAHPVSLGRRLLRGLTYALGAWSAALQIAGLAGLITLWFNPVGLLLSVASYDIQSAELFCAITCGFAAIRASRGVDRQRVGWVTLALTPMFGTAAAVIILVPYVGSIAPLFVANNIASFVAPLGLTYAMLNRRLLDIGFVVNRAAVFTGISIIVLGVFVLVEWALGAWVANVSHVTSIIVNVSVALGLGLSIRFIHRRIEHIVDALFFRKRHENETALRDFAHEAPFVTDINLLLDRAVATVTRHAESGDVAVLLRRNGGAYQFVRGGKGSTAAVSENDSALLALRTWHSSLIDLHRYETILYGEYAFPILARGQLLGVLVCGSKPHGEPYTPDEFDALKALADGVGAALDLLSIKHDDVQARILEELREIKEALLRRNGP